MHSHEMLEKIDLHGCIGCKKSSKRQIQLPAEWRKEVRNICIVSEIERFLEQFHRFIKEKVEKKKKKDWEVLERIL